MNNIKVNVLRLFTVRSLSNRIFKKALQSENYKLMEFTKEQQVKAVADCIDVGESLEKWDVKVKIMSL